MNLGYPYVGNTVEVDATPLYAKAKERDESFFVHALYALGRAGNDVKELRQRIEGNGILQFDHCLCSHTEMKDDGTYAYCETDPGLAWDVFYPKTQEARARARENGNIEEGSEALGKFFMSCAPWVHFTALVQPVPFPADSNPRITWGKFVQKEGRIILPVSILAHHGLVDGMHIGQFYEALEARMREK